LIREKNLFYLAVDYWLNKLHPRCGETSAIWTATKLQGTSQLTVFWPLPCVRWWTVQVSQNDNLRALPQNTTGDHGSCDVSVAQHGQQYKFW